MHPPELITRPLIATHRSRRSSRKPPAWSGAVDPAGSRGFLSGPAPFSNPPINQSCVTQARRAIAARQSLLVTGLDPNPE